MHRPHAIALLAAFAASVLAVPAIAQVTAFTYQGRLDLDGEPFVGDAVLAFRLFDAASGGAPIGPTSNVGPIPVTDGLITAQLDFGPGAFDGSARYLEVSIENPPGSTSFMILSPRQPILFTPMSQFANESAQWRSVGNAITNNNTGFVGINRDFVVGTEYFGVRAPVQSGYGGMYISTDTTDGLPFYGYYAGGAAAWTYLNGPTREWRLYNGGNRLRVSDQGFVSINAEPDANQQLLIESNTTAIVGRSTGNSGNGVTGTTTASSGVGVLGFATGTGSYGVYGESVGSGGYGGYFRGRGFFSGNLGVGDVVAPAYRLDVRQTSASSNIVHFERTTAATIGSDLLELEMPAGSAVGSQFIEAQLPGDTKFRVNADGNVTADGTYTAGGADFAELVPVGAGAETVEPGDVMVIDPDAMGGFARSHGARSTLVAGIYSTKPGMLGSTHDWDAVSREQGLDPEGADASTLELGAMLDEVPLAVVGIVPCKATAQNGPIRPGDLLVTSSLPGHAMRDDDPRNGTIVGKALEPLDSGTGLIRVLVTLQ